MNLAEFEINKKGEITAIVDNPVAARLMEYGILPGSTFLVLNKAAFNGPIFVQVGSNRIAIRLADAAAVLVK